MQRLENLHLIAHFGQIARAGQSGGAAAHDSHPTAVTLRLRAVLLRRMFDAPVAHEALELADGHRLALDTQYAGAFALRLLRTDAATDRGQRTVTGDHGRRGRDIALVQLENEIGNLHPDRAGRHAAGILAVQTARRLGLRLLEIIAVADLFEIGRPQRRILFAHRHARYFIRHDFLCLHSFDAPVIYRVRYGIGAPPHARRQSPWHALPACGTSPDDASPRRNRQHDRRTPVRRRR